MHNAFNRRFKRVAAVVLAVGGITLLFRIGKGDETWAAVIAAVFGLLLLGAIGCWVVALIETSGTAHTRELERHADERRRREAIQPPHANATKTTFEFKEQRAPGEVAAELLVWPQLIREEDCRARLPRDVQPGMVARWYTE